MSHEKPGAGSEPADPSRDPGGDPPAVCTLPADGLDERFAWIRREILPHAVETQRLTHGLAFELVAAPGLAATLDRLVALERECCSGLVFEPSQSAAPGRLRLEVRGLEPDAEFFRQLQASAPR